MKNIVIGWLFLIAGGALLGVSLLGMREHAEAARDSGERQERHLEAKAPLAGPERPPAPAPGEPITAGGSVGADMPAVADMPAEPAMAEPPVADPATADMPAEPAGAEPAGADRSADLREVLLVFDARSQQISRQVKEELLALGRANPDASFKIEVAAGELSGSDENEKLGKRRARAIRRILEEAGIPERRVSYKVQVPGPADGEGEQTSRQWRKATVRIAADGRQPRSTP